MIDVNLTEQEKNSNFHDCQKIEEGKWDFFPNLEIKKKRKPGFRIWFSWTKLSNVFHLQNSVFIPHLTFINGAALTASPVSLIFQHFLSAPSFKTVSLLQREDFVHFCERYVYENRPSLWGFGMMYFDCCTFKA